MKKWYGPIGMLIGLAVALMTRGIYEALPRPGGYYVVYVTYMISGYWVGKRYSVVQERLVTDPLTGVHTRDFFECEMQNEIARANRYQTPFSVIMVDIDDFKSLNDTHGHLVGDEVLKIIADTLRSNLRSSDVVARYGGDEFVVLLPLAGKEESAKTMKRVKKALAAALSDYRSGSISFGISTYPEDGDTLEGLLHVADAALYEDKDLQK